MFSITLDHNYTRQRDYIQKRMKEIKEAKNFSDLDFSYLRLMGFLDCINGILYDPSFDTMKLFKEADEAKQERWWAIDSLDVSFHQKYCMDNSKLLSGVK